MDTVWAERERLVARVAGEQPLAFLHDTLSQDLLDLTPGSGALACLLDEKGRVRAELRVLVLPGGDVLLDGEPACADGVAWLARVAPLSGCSVEELDRRCVAVRGSEAAAALRDVVPLPRAEHETTVGDDMVVVRVEWGLSGFDVLGPRHPAPDVPQVSDDDLRARETDAGRPRFGVDVDGSMIVNETPLLARAVSMTKGCYPGQETVARVHNLGRPRRALVRLEPADGLAPGRTLADGDGVVTSVGRLAAIARVRAEVASASQVKVDETDRRVTQLT